jgi:hypothetical protein
MVHGVFFGLNILWSLVRLVHGSWLMVHSLFQGWVICHWSMVDGLFFGLKIFWSFVIGPISSWFMVDGS